MSVGQQTILEGSYNQRLNNNNNNKTSHMKCRSHDSSPWFSLTYVSPVSSSSSSSSSKGNNRGTLV